MGNESFFLPSVWVLVQVPLDAQEVEIRAMRPEAEDKQNVMYTLDRNEILQAALRGRGGNPYYIMDDRGKMLAERSIAEMRLKDE